MDFSKAITWADINLNSVTLAPSGQPASGYRVDRFSPSPAPLTQYVEKRALTDGLDVSDVFLGGRNLSAIVTAYGTSVGDFWDKVQTLERIMSAPLRRQAAVDANQANTEGFGYLSFFQPTASTGVGQWPTSAYPNGIPMAFYARPIQMEYDLERSKDGGNLHSKSFRLNWLAKEPVKIHTTAVSSAFVQGVSTTNTLTYRGQYPNYPIVTWTQTATGGGNMSIFVDGFANGISISQITSGLPVTLYFDYNTRTLWAGDPLDSGSVNRSNLIGTIEAFPRVSDGSTFRVTGMSGVANVTVTLTVNEAWP